MWENVRFSMNSTMPLFFVMLLGYVLYQKKFLSDAFVAGANKFVFYVALPVQLFCFVVTLVSILGIWALAKLFLLDKRLVGEFVQVCYRSSAAILGTAFLQSIYGTAEMSSMMILGSVPLYNVMAVVILMLEGPEAAQAGYTLSPREVQPLLTHLRDNLHAPEAQVRQIGCVIGTHAGPGAFGIAFFDSGLTLA